MTSEITQEKPLAPRVPLLKPRLTAWQRSIKRLHARIAAGRPGSVVLTHEQRRTGIFGLEGGDFLCPKHLHIPRMREC